jgi:gamma-polyglutamate biosynthesis protein CapC
MVIETLLLGLILALLFAELTDISPGGIIVPGYIALHLDRPWRVLATLGAAFLCLLLYKLLARYLLLYGRRRFVLLLIAGAVVAQAWALALPGLFAAPVEIRVIGWVVPGILANSLLRQKPLPVLGALAAVSVLTYFAVRLVSGL